MKLAIKPQALTAIREARGFSERDVASALALSVQQVRELESGDDLPTKGIVSRLAELFFVPHSLFFTNNVSLKKNIADFRTTRNAPAKIGKAGLKQITQCSELQDLLLEIIPKLNLQFFSTNLRLAVQDDIDQASELVSNFLDLDANKFFEESDPIKLFALARKIIEKKKIGVISHRLASETFRGFCLAEKQQVPIIFINTFDQTAKTKLFTLVHELVHVFIRRDGISDPFKSDTNIERFCNGVTARVLMPERRFRQIFQEFRATKDAVALTRLISESLGVSLHAVALRIEELGLRANFYEEWRKVIFARYRNAPLKVVEEGEEDDDEDDDLIFRPSGARRLLSRFGYRIPSLFKLAADRNFLSINDGERLLGLSSANLPRAASIAAQEFGKDL
jgi:Zn-dependent peptidase ImmA (M78 family)